MTLAAIDTNLLVALVDSRDKWHTRACEILDALKAHSFQLMYFDCVLNESISVLARRAEEQKRTDEFVDLLEQLRRHTPEAQITWVSLETRHLYSAILDMVQQTKGAINFHDALIALACRDLKIQVIVTFDQDFD
jgi:predicted nucleic acid-binding protein